MVILLNAVKPFQELFFPLLCCISQQQLYPEIFYSILGVYIFSISSPSGLTKKTDESELHHTASRRQSAHQV